MYDHRLNTKVSSDLTYAYITPLKFTLIAIIIMTELTVSRNNVLLDTCPCGYSRYHLELYGTCKVN